MARDPRKHQQKLARRKAKEKAKAKRKGEGPLAASGIAGKIRRSAAAPVMHCCISDTLWEQGIGHVFISRRFPVGHVTFANFLVDVYCLGVKDTFFNVLPRSQYDREFYPKISQDADHFDISPEAARKLVEGAVEYAGGLGLSPHADYHKAAAIFGDIDAGACTDEFEYGQDGKPLFITGPHDGRAKCQHIINTLTQRLGRDGFRYLLPLDAMGPVGSIEPLDSEEAIIHIDKSGRLLRIPY